MKKLIARNRYFFIPYFLFLIGSIVLLLVFNKPELHIIFNKISTPAFDAFFRRITYLGDGLIYLLLLAILLFYNFRWTIVFTGAVIVSNMLVYIGKHLLFPNAYRPGKYFEQFESYQLHIVNGVKMHGFHSFPSGHTCTAFTVFVMLALLVRNNSLKFLCFAVALLTGFSRVYLSQHFLIDIVVGSAIGCGSIVMAWLYFNSFSLPWFNESLSFKRRIQPKTKVSKVVPES